MKILKLYNKDIDALKSAIRISLDIIEDNLKYDMSNKARSLNISYRDRQKNILKKLTNDS